MVTSPTSASAPVSSSAVAEPDAGAHLVQAEASPWDLTLKAWQNLSLCTSFDYFPRGGIQNFWCHRPRNMTFASLRTLSNVDVFLSGPHTADALTLDAQNAFGHYNPAFVEWAVEQVPQGRKPDPATQVVYDASIRPLAEVFWKTYAKITRDKACFDRERTLYEDAIKNKKLPAHYYERWFYFMNPFYCERAAKGLSAAKDNFYYDNAFDGGVNGNVTKSVVGFWLRRTIDGTRETFAKGLTRLVAVYEPALFASPAQPADASALSKALDTAVAASAGCKDPAIPASRASLQILFAPEGQIRTVAVSVPGGRASPKMTSCIESKFAAVQIPPFEGYPLRFRRDVTLK